MMFDPGSKVSVLNPPQPQKSIATPPGPAAEMVPELMMEVPPLAATIAVDAMPGADIMPELVMLVPAPTEIAPAKSAVPEITPALTIVAQRNDAMPPSPEIVAPRLLVIEP